MHAGTLGDTSMDLGLSEEAAQAGIASAFSVSAGSSFAETDLNSTTNGVLKTVLRNTACRQVSRDTDIIRA